MGLVQMSCTGDKEANLLKAIAKLREAAAKGAQIVCLQELFTSLYFCDTEDYEHFKLAEPVPGWIRGFRMAEPVIISLGKGLLKEFPGLPEGVVDIIPVDLVVAAIIAVAAQGGPPAGGPPAVYQVASGSRKPLWGPGMPMA